MVVSPVVGGGGCGELRLMLAAGAGYHKPATTELLVTVYHSRAGTVDYKTLQ